MEDQEILDDSTRLKKALFIKPDQVIEDIGNAIFKDMMAAEREKEKAANK